MMQSNRRAVMADAVEQEFFDAIDRLLQNKPRNRALAIKAKAGTLQINTTTVALEAGHSRTQIGHDKCKYQKVRAKILGLKNAEAEPHTAEDTIRKLRIRITEVQMELRIANSEKAALIIRMQKTEKAANREIGKAKRSAEQKNRDPNHVVGRSFSDIEAQVIQFPKNDE